jgi:hypothetical protein
MDEHPDSEIISRLGGPASVGQLCDVSSQAVSQWRRAGIPKARRMYLALLKPAAFADVRSASGPDPQAGQAAAQQVEAGNAA